MAKKFLLKLDNNRRKCRKRFLSNYVFFLCQCAVKYLRMIRVNEKKKRAFVCTVRVRARLCVCVCGLNCK
jgi:hypothetical protein